MRPPPDMPTRPSRVRAPGSGRGRAILIVALIALFIVATSLRGMAGVYTDFLWFDSLDLGGVWRGILGAKVALVVIFTSAFFVLVYGNLFIADRLAPTIRLPDGPEDELVERYHEMIGRRAGLLRVAVSLLLALVAGSGVSSHWESWILFTNRVDFGTSDATFGVDVGFYVFQLPFLEFVLDWLFQALVVVLVATAVAHYLNGGIRVQAAGERVAPQVKAHVSVLLGALALVKACDYWLQRYELVFSTRGVVDGATYTDVNVQETALFLLIIISITAAVLFLVNIRRRGWVLPAIAVGLWVFVNLLAGEIIPTFVQRVRVESSELQNERPYITQNIEATREALNLGEVVKRDFDADGALTAADLEQDVNAAIIDNIRLWDPAVAERSLQRSQGSGFRGYYDLVDVDVDRYEIDGDVVQMNVAARNLRTEEVPQQSWVAQRLIYTHGYGGVASPMTEVTPDGQPRLTVRDLPVESEPGAPQLGDPGLYIGEGQSGYAIVNTKEEEFDYPFGNQDRTTSYKGLDGVPIDSFVRRAAFALRFGDLDPLISSSVTADSRVLYQRDVMDRVRVAAPFLKFDTDPYPVLTDGRIVWVVDAYTTTDRYPNAQRVDTGDLDPSAELRTGFNYVRNSVKAVVDAYDGTVTFYVVDAEDPIIRAYEKAFPELFTSGEDVPADLRTHFRYPEELFRVQTTMWGRYHLDTAAEFFNADDEWNVAPDPEISVSTPTAGPTTTLPPDSAEVSRSRRIDPYYMQLALPGEEEATFALIRPFVPGSSNGGTRALRAILTASSDPDDYGRLISYQMPADQSTAGPQDIGQAITASAAVSQQVTLLCQQASSCPTTNLLVIPIERSLLYIRPLYVESDIGGSGSVPQLQRMIAVLQDETGSTRVRIAPTLKGAIDALFEGEEPITPPSDPGEEPTDPGEEPTDPGEEPAPPGNADELIAQIVAAFDAADAALTDGDLAEYQRQVELAQSLSHSLEALLGAGGTGGNGDGEGEGSTTTTTTPATEPEAPPTTA